MYSAKCAECNLFTIIVVLLFVHGFVVVGVNSQLGVTTCTFATQANCPNFMANSYCDIFYGVCACPTIAGYVNDGTNVSCTYDCGEPVAPTNGEVDTSAGTYTGDIATFSCNNGYSVIGPLTSICVADSGWNTTSTFCTPVDCGDFPTVIFGEVIGDSTIFRSIAIVTCLPDYELDGPNEILCEDDGSGGKWSTPGNCSAIKNGLGDTCFGDIDCTADNSSCADWSDVCECISGFVNINGTCVKGCSNADDCTLNNTICNMITFQCVCSQNYTNASGVCVYDCGRAPSVSVDGLPLDIFVLNILSVGFAPVGSQAIYTCPGFNYTMSSKDFVVCLEGGWDTFRPKCVPDCGSFADPEFSNTAVNVIDSEYGASVNTSCVTGYEPNTTIIACLGTGEWETFVCTKKDCGSVDISVIDIDTEYGASVNASCVTGYEPNTTIIECLATGEWGTFVCAKKECGPIDAPEFSDISIIDIGTEYGASVNASCVTGYEPNTTIIECLGTGEWETFVCTKKDCGHVDAPEFSDISVIDIDTEYGASVNASCVTGYEPNTTIIECLATGEWGTFVCAKKDCGPIDVPEFSDISVIDIDTEYGASVNASCVTGYEPNTTIIECLATGEWETFVCAKKDCGSLQSPTFGRVALPDGSLYSARAKYTCNEGYTLVGDTTRVCQATGQWDGVAPTCAHADQTIIKCPDSTDTRGNVWNEIIGNGSRTLPCSDGYLGNITRKCSETGEWSLPKNNCIRKVVQNVYEMVVALDDVVSDELIDQALDEITGITEAAVVQNDTDFVEGKLTDGELVILSSSLQTVGELLNNNTDFVNEQIINSFISSVSNLLDESNKDSWRSQLQSGSNGAENILKSVTSLGEAIGKTLNNTDKKTILKKNLAMEVQKFSKSDVVFPDSKEINNDDQDGAWIWTTNNKQIEFTAAVIYKDVSDILPSETKDTDSESSTTSIAKRAINGPLLALTIWPKDQVSEKFEQPVQITFEHKESNLTSPVCSFWQFKIRGQGSWSTAGCLVQSTNRNFTICECNHLTNFAVLMSPFAEVDSTSTALRVISIVGIAISISCILATFIVHITVWRYVRSNRTTILMNLCVSLLFAYVAFLAGVDRTESTIACAVIAGFLQYIYLVVFCVMLVEGIEILITVMYVFKTKSRIKLLLICAWVVPGIIVAISALVTKGEGYGNGVYCWLSTGSGLIWSFVGPALFIIFFNIICIILVMRAMYGTAAMASKDVKEKAKASVRSLCVLVPVMGISWLLGIFYVNDGLIFVQFIFTILNGLQGLFIFIFHCLFNAQMRKVCSLRERRRASSKEALRSTLRSTSRDDKNAKKLSESIQSTLNSLHNSNNSDSDVNSDWRSHALQFKRPANEVRFTASLAAQGIGRPAAPFTSISHDSMPGGKSYLLHDSMRRQAHDMGRFLYSERL